MISQLRARRACRPLTLGLLVLLIPFFVGCYGRFALTRGVHSLNGQITDQALVHTAVCWVFVIFPVYGFAFLIDFFVLNTLEYWTGARLMAQAEPEGDAEEQGRGWLALAPSPEAAVP